MWLRPSDSAWASSPTLHLDHLATLTTLTPPLPVLVLCCAAVAGKSDKLRGASKIYVSQARYLNTQALLRKYAPLAFVMLLVLGMLWWRFR